MSMTADELKVHIKDILSRGKPAWYLPMLRDVAAALRETLGSEHKVWLRPGHNEVSIFVRVSPDTEYRVLRMDHAEPSCVRFTGFQGTITSTKTTESGPVDADDLERALLETMADTQLVVRTCRILD
jgi:hypothetical protein